MPTLVPPPGRKTLWEDRCILVHFDDAQDAAGMGKVMPSVVLMGDVPAELLPQHPAVYPPDAAGDSGDEGTRASFLERLASHLHAAASPLALGRPLALLWSSFLSGCRPRASAPPLHWHPRQPWLAAADPSGRVQIIGLGPQGPAQRGQVGRAAGEAGRPELVLAGGGGGCVKCVLAHPALQQQALSLAWSPTSPGQLAVGAGGAVCLWALAGEGRPPVAAAGRAAGPWMRHLRTRVPGARVVSLSWSPDGRLLAAASPDQAGLQVWEVASGVATPVGAGPAAFDTVRWSPCGNYVFAAGTGGRYFYIFETQRWRWARWEVAGSAAAPLNGAGAAAASTSAGASPAALPSVVAAAWAPSGPGRNPVLLAALSGQSYLVALHLVDAPPGLTAQLLPVMLPELARGAAAGARADGGASADSSADAPSGGSAASAASPSIADMAWDPLGERLAVLLAGSSPQDVQLAVYCTSTDPLVSARLLGFARPPAALASAGSGSAAPAVQSAEPATPAPGPSGGAGAAPSLCALPGALTVARLGPVAGSGAGGTAGPACVASARVGALGIYNLPCYF